MKKKTILVLLGIVILAAGIVTAVVLSGKKELNINSSTVAEGTVEVTVMATGYVQPVEKVDVGTQVSGVIEKIYVDYNSVVKKGDLLAELDRSTLQEKLTQSNASLASALSDQAYAKQNFERTKELFEKNAATKVSYEEAENRLVQANTSVTNARANVHQANVNLSYASITSPINGVVLDRAVNVGQTVAASFNTPTLFTIAEDLTKMQVEADVDEADIGKVRVGQKVTFTVDAYSMDTFEGVVEQIRLQPIVTNNVVTYTVIIEAPNPDNKLFPGMTANITIVAESETGLTVPVEAVNFRMTPEISSKVTVKGNDDQKPQDQGAKPANAAQNRQHGREVWVKTADGLERRPITTGINDGVSVVVKSGLTEGEEVVLSASMEKKKKGQATSNPLMPDPRRR